jgi:hypothetical protein
MFLYIYSLLRMYSLEDRSVQYVQYIYVYIRQDESSAIFTRGDRRNQEWSTNETYPYV